MSDRKKRSRRVSWVPFAFLSPYLVLALAFFVGPFIEAARLAFYQTNGPLTRVFVGLSNFRFVLEDPDFHRAVLNTAYFAIANGLVLLPVSLGLALLLDSGGGRFISGMRLILCTPSFVGQIFVGIIFAVIFLPNYGLFNRAAYAFFGWGLETHWLQTPALVIPAVIIANLWIYSGFNMVYFLAALQSVDESLVEAARLDGAGSFGVFWHVTLPAIKPVAVFVYVVSTIYSLQLFELPYAMLMGASSGSNAYGPANSGLTMVGYLYDAAFNAGDLGVASTVGWILALAIFFVSMLQLRLAGEFGENAS